MQQEGMPYELNETDIFALLAKQRRRHLLQLLQESSQPLTMIELANRIENSNNDPPTIPESRNIQLSLHHTHIPKLEDADVVKYDKNEGTVQPARNFVILMQFLENVREDDLPWSNQ